VRNRYLAFMGAIALVTAVAMLGQAPPAGQAPSKAKESAKAPAPKKTWMAPRTPDGVPDLQGFWTNSTLTPLERPKGLGSKEFYTDEEIAAAQKKDQERLALNVAEGRPAEPGTADAVHYDFAQFGLDKAQSSLVWDRRTSLIVGPTGTIPALLPEARKRAADIAAKNKGHEFDGPENRPLSARCIILGYDAVPMLPQGYNNNLQIVQGQGYVAVLHEMNHSVRIIPTDGQPHAPNGIPQLRGDSKGHWEGDTLVVDVKGLDDRTWFDRAGDYHSDALHVVERYTPTGPDTLNYEATIEDSKVFSRPWKISMPLYRHVEKNARLMEFKCVEFVEELMYGQYSKKQSK
jgi:hypothetical protein